jgi:threonine aldolase
MRFLTAPWPVLFRDGKWLQIASHANQMARRLREGLEMIPSVSLLYPTEANAVFARLPEKAHEVLRSAGWRYYLFIGNGARFMCSWSTQAEEVDALLKDIAGAV